MSVGRLSIPTSNLEAEDVVAVQRARSAALLAGDMQAAELIHADDFQLVTPLGAVFSRAQYLGAVEAGIIRYAVMELDSPVDSHALSGLRGPDALLASWRNRYGRAGAWPAGSSFPMNGNP